MKIAVRIELNENKDFVIKRIDYTRFSFHGFGSFIWKLKPQEVSISPEAFTLLRARVGARYTSLGDLSGLDFSVNHTAYQKKYNGFTMSYGGLCPILEVPLEDILIDYESYELLELADKSPTTLECDPDDIKRWDEIEKASDKEANKLVKKFYSKEFIPKN